MSVTSTMNMLLKEVQLLRNALQIGIVMRDAQKDYFNRRTQASLVLSKQMETEFDKAARAALAEEKKS